MVEMQQIAAPAPRCQRIKGQREIGVFVKRCDQLFRIGQIILGEGHFLARFFERDGGMGIFDKDRGGGGDLCQFGEFHHPHRARVFTGGH